MKLLLKTLSLIILTTHFSFGQIQGNLELIDIFNMEFISSPEISPDGTKILFVRNFKDVMTDRNLSNIWITNYDGSNMRPLTTGNQNDFSPKWSNDGKKIVAEVEQSGANPKEQPSHFSILPKYQQWH